MTVRRTLHRTGRHLPIAEVPVGAWIYDDRNDEAARFEGWSRVQSCYLAEWSGGGWFCMWDTDGSGRPTTLELLEERE